MYYEVRSTVNGMTAVDFFSTMEKANAYIEKVNRLSKGRATTSLRQVEKLPYKGSAID